MKVLKLGTVKFEPFQHNVKVIITDDVGEYGCSIGCHNHSEFPEATHFSSESGSILAFHPFPSPDTVAHECWHAVYRMLSNADADLDNETVAYFLGYLVDKISDMLYNRSEEMQELSGPCECPRCLAETKKAEKADKPKPEKVNK